MLSPAYDQLNTRLVLPDGPLAMPVCGKRANLSKSTWRQLAERMRIADKAAIRVRTEIADCLPGALRLVAASPLPDEMRAAYAEQLEARAPR